MARPVLAPVSAKLSSTPGVTWGRAVGAQSLRSSSAWRVFRFLSRLPAVTIQKSVPGRQGTVDYAVTERLFALDGDDDCVVWPLVWPNCWKSCCKVLYAC
jgi:hypothetical protein